MWYNYDTIRNELLVFYLTCWYLKVVLHLNVLNRQLIVLRKYFRCSWLISASAIMFELRNSFRHSSNSFGYLLSHLKISSHKWYSTSRLGSFFSLAFFNDFKLMFVSTTWRIRFSKRLVIKYLMRPFWMNVILLF